MTRYLQTQKQHSEEIEEYQKQRIQKITENITRNGGVNSREFWKIRKCILNQKGCEYDLVTEESSSTRHGQGTQNKKDGPSTSKEWSKV